MYRSCRNRCLPSRIVAATLCLVVAVPLALAVSPTTALADGSGAGLDVSLVGSFESAVSADCADWTPDCSVLMMQPVDGEDESYAVTVDVPAGDWQFEVAVAGDRHWYGASGQDEKTPLSLPNPVTIEFQVDLSNHVTTMTPLGAQAPGLAAPPTVPAMASTSAPGERFYFVLTDRFADGDPTNDDAVVPDNRQPDVIAHPSSAQDSGYNPTQIGYYQGGDLQGVIDHLDYIKGLGATAIWLTPPFVNMPVSQGSAGYHGYWITDFTHIDPHLGGDAAMVDLIDAAHAKGLKVYFDIVLNHTADTISYQGFDGEPPYVSLATKPYTDVTGQPFDPADYASGTNGAFPAMDPATSFPYVPYRPDPAMWLVPNELNDLTWYHNRGAASTVGSDESTNYGDFSGLDDLMTERPELARLMVSDVVVPWVAQGVDGFRIDTVKYVGLDFWKLFDAGVHADDPGTFLFGEAYDSNVAGVVAPPLRQGGMNGMLDFPYALSLPSFIRDGKASSVANVFASDAYYATASTSPGDMVTFVDNHDMGRLGSILGPNTPDLARRIALAYELTYLVRGQPVVYYGDEQDFLGQGGDTQGRGPMFGPVNGGYDGSPYASYPLAGGGTLGSDYAENEYDTSAPLYQTIAGLAALREAHPVLSTGAQVTLSSDGSVFAFDRLATDVAAPTENLVAVNASSDAQTVELTTLTPGATYTTYYPADASVSVTADQDGHVSLTVPGLTALALEADRPVATAELAPDSYSLTSADAAGGLVSLTASVPGNRWTTTSFFARQVGTDPTDASAWNFLGTADGPTATVYADPSDFPTGALLEYRAVTTDSTGLSVAASVGGAGVWVVSPHDLAVRHGVGIGLAALVIVVLVGAIGWTASSRTRRQR